MAAREVERKPSTAGSLLGFFAITFAVTWAFFIAAVAWSNTLARGEGLGPGISALILLGTFAPSYVAIALTGLSEGGTGVRALLRRLFLWQVSARWYVFAISYIAVIKLTSALIGRVATGAWPEFGRESLVLMLGAMVLSTMIGGQAGEEIGWRGYALPRLAARFGLGGASVLLGIAWATWHLPLFYLHGADTYGQSFPVYLVQVTAISVAIAFLYWRTNGSLLLTMLMHAAINNTKDIVPSIARAPDNPFMLTTTLMSWIGMALMWIVAAYFLARMRRATTIPGSEEAGA